MVVLERPTGTHLDARHATPEPATRCKLWLTIRTGTRGGGHRVELSGEEPAVFLHLRATNLLVALPDEEPALLDRPTPVAIRLSTTDALGLGLTPADFEHGVGLCGGAEADAVSGWRCRNATIIGLDDAGGEWPLTGPGSFRRWIE